MMHNNVIQYIFWRHQSQWLYDAILHSQLTQFRFLLNLHVKLGNMSNSSSEPSIELVQLTNWSKFNQKSSSLKIGSFSQSIPVIFSELQSNGHTNFKTSFWSEVALKWIVGVLIYSVNLGVQSKDVAEIPANIKLMIRTVLYPIRSPM